MRVVVLEPLNGAKVKTGAPEVPVYKPRTASCIQDRRRRRVFFFVALFQH